MIYFVVFILLLIPVVKYDWVAKTGGENKWYYFNLVVLILFAGLRYRVGGDTLMYMSMFDDCPKLDELKYFDFSEAVYQPLWYVFNAICKSIYDSFTFFQLVHATIVNVTFFHFFRKYCRNYYFSVILLYYVAYFCYFNMEVMREVLCICILMWATPLLYAKRWGIYLLCCVAAFFIHFSSIVMFVFPLLFKIFKEPSWKWQTFMLVLVVVMMNVVNIIALLLSLFAINEQLSFLLEKYIENERSIMGMIAQLLAYIPLFGFIYLHEKHPQKMEYDFVPIVMCVVIFYALSMNFEGFARLVNYFIPFMLVYMVTVFYHIVSEKTFKAHQITYCVLFAAMIMQGFNYTYYYVRDMSEFYPNTRFYTIFAPYHSVFDPKIEEQREAFIENYRDVAIFF